MHSHFLPSSSDLSAAFASISAPLLRARLTGDDGEGEDGGPGAGKKATAKAKGRATSRGGSLSRAGLPQGWIQGDWILSTIRQEDLDDLTNGGLIPHGSARLPGKESEPQPEEGEVVLLATHVDRGFSLPPHPFFRGFLNFFGAQLHHFTPNTIVYLTAFVSLCENFLGCRPHWGLFKHIFTCRSQTVKKANPSDERTQVIQMCGGLGVQMRGKSSFPAMILPDSVRGWQSTWFYCKDQPTPGRSTGIPPFSVDRVRKPSSLKVIPEEKAQVKVLVERVVQLIRDGGTGMDLLEVFLRRRIQPLQYRDHPMWMYSGTEDTTRIHPGRSRMPRWRGGWLPSQGTRTTPEGPGGFLHSTNHTK